MKLVAGRWLLIGVAWLAVLAAARTGAGHVSGRLCQQVSPPGCAL